MDGSMPASRRKARSWRITTGVGLLGLATLVVASTQASGDLFVVRGAGVFALVVGWVALQLASNGIVRTRFEHAADRTEIARAHRTLLEERAQEHRAFVAAMSARLTVRDETIHSLQGSLVGSRTRVVEAERAVSTVRGRLADAESQIASLEEQVVAAHQERTAAQAQQQDTVVLPRKLPLLGLVADPVRVGVAPELADMSADPIAALLAWEEHSDLLAGRQCADEWPVQEA